MTAVGILEPGARNTATGPASSFERVWRIVRLHYANRLNSVIAPLNIALLIFLVFWIVQALVVYATGQNVQSGQGNVPGLIYFLPYQIVFAVQATNLTFAYALGLSSTRRDFSLGTWLMFLIQSAGFSLIFTAMSYLEEWTTGWGVHAQIFHTPLYGTGGLGLRLLTYFSFVVFMQCVGSVFGAVFVRWHAVGLYVLGGAMVLVLLGSIALITFNQWWMSVGAWFVAVGPAGFAAWLLLPAALFAVIGHLALRRATPKS